MGRPDWSCESLDGEHYYVATADFGFAFEVYHHRRWWFGYFLGDLDVIAEIRPKRTLREAQRAVVRLGRRRVRRAAEGMR